MTAGSLQDSSKWSQHEQANHKLLLAEHKSYAIQNAQHISNTARDDLLWVCQKWEC